MNRDEIAKQTVAQILARVDGSRSSEIEMVRAVVDEIREGLRRPPAFVDMPPELPDGPAMSRLLLSRTSADAELRATALDWIEDLRGEASRAAAALRPIVLAVRLADRLVGGARSQEESELIWGWRQELVDYATLAFRCNVIKAPAHGPELDAWCMVVANRGNPAPAIPRARHGESQERGPRALREMADE